MNIPDQVGVAPSGAVTSLGYGHSALRPLRANSQSNLRAITKDGDASWLVQTGLILTESSRENKGQSWLSKRDSSTSLAGPSAVTSPLEESFSPVSGRATPNRSRGPSRSRRSKRDLLMTSVSVDQPDVEDIQPQWADKETQAEYAASVPNYFQTVAQDEAPEEVDADPYEDMDFEGQFDDGSDIVDEEAVRRELTSSGLGRWFDGMVDVFLMLEGDVQDPVESPDALATSTHEPADVECPENPQMHLEDTEFVEPPPENPRGVWDDLRWLGRLVARTITS
jgi:hypothetical protein